MNEIKIDGRLGRDCKPFNGGVKFSIANTREFTTKSGEKKKFTTWVNVTLWKDEFFAKGEMVSVVGELVSNTYNDKTTLEISSRNVARLGESNPEPKQDDFGGYEPEPNYNVKHEDVPF